METLHFERPRLFVCLFVVVLRWEVTGSLLISTQYYLTAASDFSEMPARLYLAEESSVTQNRSTSKEH